jgi:hypothetical protein
VAVPSRDGSLAVLEVALEVVVIPKQLPLDQWALGVSTALLADPAASDLVSVAALMVGEVEEASEEVSKIEEAMAAVVEEEVLDTKAASHPEADSAAATVVGMVAQTDMVLPLPTLLLAPVVHVVEAVATAEEGMVALDLLIATALGCPRLLVGMIRVVVAAHMMTDPADTVATTVEDTETVMEPHEVEAVAIWSR